MPQAKKTIWTPPAQNPIRDSVDTLHTVQAVDTVHTGGTVRTGGTVHTVDTVHAQGETLEPQA